MQPIARALESVSPSTGENAAPSSAPTPTNAVEFGFNE